MVLKKKRYRGHGAWKALRACAVGLSAWGGCGELAEWLMRWRLGAYCPTGRGMAGEWVRALFHWATPFAQRPNPPPDRPRHVAPSHQPFSQLPIATPSRLPTAHARCACHAPCPLYLFFLPPIDALSHSHPMAEPLQASNPRWQCAPSLCLQPSSLPSPCASTKTPNRIAHPSSQCHLRLCISPKSLIFALLWGLRVCPCALALLRSCHTDAHHHPTCSTDPTIMPNRPNHHAQHVRPWSAQRAQHAQQARPWSAQHAQQARPWCAQHA